MGLKPREILAAPKTTLIEVTRAGGSIAFEERAQRLRTAAQVVVEDFDDDLAPVLKLPTQKAK